MPDPTLEQVKKIIDELLTAAGVKKGRKIEKLIRTWNKVTTGDISGHTRIVNLIQGTLVIEVDNYALMQELQFQSQDLLKGLRQEGDILIKNIRFNISSRNEDE
ncbi:DUF721 domain-containing protein [Planctomycetota bacterium]